MRKRNHIIPIHLNKKELAYLESQVTLSGLSREEFLRTLIMGAELRARPCEHHADLLHKAAGLCNNANQLAKVANTYGEASRQSVEEMTKIARQVWEEVKEKW
ncbi:plasmid mobilization protein [Massiliimalia timonensis]|uniref:plasmid mobilization protein n=1 Tax=Massiliimalia timonensis TaxID=1987501 RepID=UPI000B8B4061|nr:plasmid mobilization relaxosome protein MobC [Massiliimalia timonensis]